jgi:hypothetical protein
LFKSLLLSFSNSLLLERQQDSGRQVSHRRRACSTTHCISSVEYRSESLHLPAHTCRDRCEGGRGEEEQEADGMRGGRDERRRKERREGEGSTPLGTSGMRGGGKRGETERGPHLWVQA